jgi:hypothetical protein
MSTKTTFKRVALVAVAALGLGVLSVAPSQAVHAGDTLIVTPVTSAITVGETATANVNSSFSALAAGDSITVNALQVTPATASGTLAFAIVDSYTSTITTAGTTAAGSASISTGATSAPVSANTNYRLNFVSPTTAGTYTIRVVTSVGSGGGVITSAPYTWTVTVAAAATASKAITQLTKGTETATAAAGAKDSSIVATKVPAATPVLVGRLAVTLQDAAGNTKAESYTATITGAGILGQGSTAGVPSPTGTPVGRSITMAHGNAVHIFADGTGGVGTITITTAAGAVVATKTVQFYGDAAAIVLSVRRDIAVASSATGDVVRASVFDANGYPVNGAEVYATSSDQTIIASDYVKFTSADDVSGSTGVTTPGIAKISLRGMKLGTARITVGLAKNATDVATPGYAIKSDPISVRVAGSATERAGVIVSMDKQSYSPGSFAWVTITPVDAAGVKLAPGTYTLFSAAGITTSSPVESFTAVLSGGAFTETSTSGTVSTIVGTSVPTATSSNGSSRTVANPVVELDGTFIQKIKLPNLEGDFTISWTTAAAAEYPGNIAAAGVAGSITVPIANPANQITLDAVAEATDAANAATDSALAAADAADAATAAAEDASASVAALSKKVTTALNNLKKQITALTALVNKLLKR